MAGLDDRDNLFSDDDFDTLPQKALEALERNALEQTQLQTQATQILDRSLSSEYRQIFEDEDLDDAVIFNESRDFSTSVIPGLSTTFELEQFQQNQREEPHKTTSFTSGSSKLERSHPEFPLRNYVLEEPPQNTFNNEDKQQLAGLPGPSVDNLQKQIQELLRERDNLQQDLSAKAGEIAIVRSRQEKAAKEYEKQLDSAKILYAEKLAKQQRIIEEALDAERKAATELEFVRRDLFEEAEKVRNLKKAQEKKNEVTNDSITTPKKKKAAAYRDGFNDEEIHVISPSKFRPKKPNPSTPTKTGAKRKRIEQESPIATLEVEKDEPLCEEPPIIFNQVLLERIRKPDDRLNFLETVLDHRPQREHLRTIEAFANHFFPSDPKVSLASIVLGELSTLKQSPSDFPIAFCELVIALWERCLNEKYYKPIYLLVDLLVLCLELKTTAIAPSIIDTLLPAAQEAAELVASRRFSCESTAGLEKDIDVSACLTVIYLTALGCMNKTDDITRFWQRMKLEFVLTILSPNQPVKDFDMMLQLLSMTTMNGRIGPQTVDSDLSQDNAAYILDRMSWLLISSPTVPAGVEKYPSSVISDLRFQILRTLYTFCQSTWAAEAIAVHRLAIGRLVRLMSDELDAMYDYRSGHKQSARIVCLSIRILHHLITKHEAQVNLQEKLSRVHGGSQKYLICLTRLNYSEGDLVLDADIEPEVAECAHEMLELAVTPEEGDAIDRAYSGGT